MKYALSLHLNQRLTREQKISIARFSLFLAAILIIYYPASFALRATILLFGGILDGQVEASVGIPAFGVVVLSWGLVFVLYKIWNGANERFSHVKPKK